MSKLGKDLISALKEAKKKGLVPLQTSPNIKKITKGKKPKQKKLTIA